jgi:hypothetical protein
MFQKLYSIINKTKKLSEREAWLYVINEEVKKEIIRLNTEEQLEEYGIDSKGNSLGGYSPYTISIKKLKGQRTDHVTLKDTGAFYESFKINVDYNGFEIEADDESMYDNPLSMTYGVDIIGLTEENKASLHEYLLENYGEYIKRAILS